jgi:hypothetical protein
MLQNAGGSEEACWFDAGLRNILGPAQHHYDV